ncbi:MAG TPA: hypothetical protein VH134_04485 [Candidatus Dormibacteraeota bacterium]|nr:hypothetical protein [Candidatus Dormibacteraeota bacterium]
MATDLHVDRMQGAKAPSVPEPYVPMGADRKRFAHVRETIDRLVGERRPPLYDSVVIVGGLGITAHTFAARLARSPEFAGNVVLAGPPASEDRRLKAGVSLRAASADFLAYTLNTSTDRVVAQCAGGHATAQPVAFRQTASMAYKDAQGRWQNTRVEPWQGGKHGKKRPGMYGFRNSRAALAIKELAFQDGLIEKPEPVTSLEHARSLATGRRPLIVNVTTNGALLGNETTRPRAGIVAAQMPFRERPGGVRGPLTPATTYAPLVNREGAIDVGYYTPFSDPLSPDATWYGIMARPLRLSKPFDKERELDILVEETLGLGELMGLDPVDPDETTGRAFVPAPPPRAPRGSLPGTLELRRACTPFVAAYYADGMTGGTIGATIAAEAVLRGRDPYPAVARALAGYRRWNYAWYIETAYLPAVVDRLMRVSVRGAMLWPHRTAVNHWFSRA